MNVTKFITDNGATIFRVDGKLIYSSVDKLKNGIDSAIEDGASQIIINLKAAHIIDSASVGLLISRSRALKKKGGSFCFCELQPAIVRLFEIIGADQKPYIFITENEALECFQKRVGQSQEG
jgi:anti-anti-sigma factor